MGVSNTIEEQQKSNAAFQTYINEQTKVLETISAKAKEDLLKTIAEYAKTGGWDDLKPYVAGDYKHLTTTSEWSLDSLSRMIGQVKDAIFGKPAPAGTTLAADASSLVKNVAKMSEMQVLIATAAFEAIQGLLTSFTSRTETSIKNETVTKVLAPGLVLFCTVIENQYSHRDFLSNETILQTVYIFETRMSVKQAGDIAHFNQVQDLIALQASLSKQLVKIGDAIDKLDFSIEADANRLVIYGATIDKVKQKLRELSSEINDQHDTAHSEMQNSVRTALLQSKLALA